MIITGRNVDEQYLYRTPVFLLTGDVETAKFYSDLASASSKLGYFVEDVIESFIEYPNVGVDQLGLRDDTYVLVKVKIASKIPDFVLVSSENKTVSVYEVKTNLKNLDSKQAFGEKIKHEELKNHLQNIFKDYTITMYVVDFFEGPSLKVNLYKDDDLLITISGRMFCEHMGISFDDVMNSVTEFRKQNCAFIESYKSKPVCLKETSVANNLMSFI